MTLQNAPTDPVAAPGPVTLHLPDADATARLGAALAGHVRPGDTILLEGPIGAGKSHLARALILALLARDGRREDVPSPSYTLVQSYDSSAGRIVHADLYRLSDPDEIVELGLDAAFEEAICLVEWPERLGTDAPPDALRLSLAPSGEGREARLASGPGWQDRLAALLAEAAA